jgi:hypothetical protein
MCSKRIKASLCSSSVLHLAQVSSKMKTLYRKQTTRRQRCSVVPAEPRAHIAGYTVLGSAYVNVTHSEGQWLKFLSPSALADTASCLQADVWHSRLAFEHDVLTIWQNGWLMSSLTSQVFAAIIRSLNSWRYPQINLIIVNPPVPFTVPSPPPPPTRTHARKLTFLSKWC